MSVSPSKITLLSSDFKLNKVEWFFVCGMIRSGSTLIYLVLSSLLEKHIHVNRAGFIHPEEIWRRQSFDGGASVIKLHHYDPEIGNSLKSSESLGFYSFRDPRDVVVSVMRKYKINFEKALEWLIYTVNVGNRWEATPGVLVLRYEEFFDEIPKLCSSICSHIGFECDPAIIAEISSIYSLDEQKKRIENIPKNKYDPISLLHHNHIGLSLPGAWRECLSSKECCSLESAISDWMSSHGYSLESNLLK